MRTKDELNQASEALLYEYRMLLTSAGFLGSQIAADSDLALCVLESFLVHLRNLLDFFYSEPKRASDCSAGDYLPDVAAWRQEIEEHLLSPTNEILRRIHKDLAHLTYDRIGKEPEDRQWEVTRIALAVVRVMTAFRRDVPDRDSFSRKWDCRWHDLERLEGTLSGQDVVLGS